LLSGQPAKRFGNAHPNIVPYQVFYAKDKPISLAAANPRQFRRFCELAGRPDLADDPHFGSNADRLANRDELVAVVQSLIEQKTAAEWMTLLNENGVPAGPINTVGEAFADPQVRALGIVGSLPHATAGDVPFVGSPISLSATPVHPRTAPPLLGADTESVLTEVLGMSAGQVQRLRDEGAI
ncbi:MAG: CoA transferase, partial [Dehalococcoidia bacterium]